MFEKSTKSSIIFSSFGVLYYFVIISATFYGLADKISAIALNSIQKGRLLYPIFSTIYYKNNSVIP